MVCPLVVSLAFPRVEKKVSVEEEEVFYEKEGKGFRARVCCYDDVREGDQADGRCIY